VNHKFAVLSGADLLAARDRQIGRLTRLFAGEDDGDAAFVLFGVEAKLDGARARDAQAAVDGALSELADRADALRDDRVFRPLTLECDIFGVHFVDKIFGAKVFDLDDSWQAQVLGRPVGRLGPPELDRDPTWCRAREFAAAFLKASVAVPYFGLPTIASALNIGVNLYGQELLLALLENPEAARHDLKVINDVLCTMHRWYRQTLPPEQLQPVVGAFRTQPPGFGQLCGCTTQLVSDRQYRDFVAPLDAELLGVHPHGGMIHLCGSHRQHIPAWREMRPLRAVQVNDRAADDLAHYWHGLRDDQIVYVNPTAFMTVDRIMEMTNGHRVVIVWDVQEPGQVRKRSVTQQAAVSARRG